MLCFSLCTYWLGVICLSDYSVHTDIAIALTVLNAATCGGLGLGVLGVGVAGALAGVGLFARTSKAIKPPIEGTEELVASFFKKRMVD